MALGDLYRARATFQCYGLAWRNYLWFQITVQPAGLVPAQEVSDQLDVDMTPKFAAAMDAQCVLADWRVWPVDADARLPGWTPSTIGEGALLAVRLPPSAACRFILEQQTRPARCNGELNLSGLNFTGQRDGTIPRDLTLFGDYFNNLAVQLGSVLTTSSGAELRPVIMSRSQLPAATIYGDPLPITGVTVDPRLRALPDRVAPGEGLAPLLESGPF